MADIRGFLEDRGWPDATLIGLSMGGLNAIAFAASHPERARGLVVVDVAPTVERAGRDAIGRQLTRRDFDSFEEAVANRSAGFGCDVPLSDSGAASCNYQASFSRESRNCLLNR